MPVGLPLRGSQRKILLWRIKKIHVLAGQIHQIELPCPIEMTGKIQRRQVDGPCVMQLKEKQQHKKEDHPPACD